MTRTADLGKLLVMPEMDVPVATLIVAGDDRKAIARAADLDDVLLDLAAASDKASARSRVTDLIADGDVRRLVRVNDWTTRWTYRDVIEVVEGAGEAVSAIVLPRVRSSHDVVALDLLLTQIETTMELAAGSVGIVAQLDDARGVQAAAGLTSPRLRGLATGVVEFAPAVRLAARAADLPVFALATSEDEIEAARDDGFDGVWVDDPELVAGARIAFGA